MAEQTFTFDDVKEILVRLIGLRPDQLPDDPDVAFEDLGLDSIHFILIEVEMEQRYGLRIPEADAGQLHNIANAIDYVNRRLEEKEKPTRR